MAKFIVTIKRWFQWEGEAEDERYAELKALHSDDLHELGLSQVEDIEEVTDHSTSNWAEIYVDEHD